MSTSLPGRFFCAPMAELTTPALRGIIKGFGPDTVLCSEMLSAGAVCARSSHNEPLIARFDFDEPYIYQLVGSSEGVMAGACSILSEKKPYAIDINMGCSAPDIMKTGGGARLLSDPEKARAIVRACRRETRCRLSVKMRAGYDSTDGVRITEFGSMLEDEGVDFITIHGRTAKMGFRRKADWTVVRRLRETLHIPVIGNGDINSAGDAVRRMRESGCDAVMIGRQAAVSPWIFALCSALDRGSGLSLEVNVEETFLRVLDGIKKHLPGTLHKSRGHRFSFYFSRNAGFAHGLFTLIRKHPDIDGMAGVVSDYYARNPHERMKTLLIHGGDAHEDR